MTKTAMIVAILTTLVCNVAYAGIETDNATKDDLKLTAVVLKQYGETLATQGNKIKTLEDRIATNETSSPAAPQAAAPPQTSQVEGKPTTPRWLYSVKKCPRLDTLPIREQNTLSEKLEKSTEKGMVEWIKDCIDPNWRQFAYYGAGQQVREQQHEEPEAADEYAEQPQQIGYRPGIYEGNRAILRLQELGPRGRVIEGRPAPRRSIECVVAGVHGRCVPR